MTSIAIGTFIVTGGPSHTVCEVHDRSAKCGTRVFFFTRTAAGHMVGWKRNYGEGPLLKAIYLPDKMTAAIAHAISKDHSTRP